MSEWLVSDFMSRVAEQVTNAGNDLVALVEGGSTEAAFSESLLAILFARVEPSPDFVATLYRELLAAPIVAMPDPVTGIFLGDRRIVYGMAAIGSLASAAVVAALIWRNRAHRLAA